MSDPAVDALLARLGEAGVELWSEAGRLRFRAPRGALTAALRAEVADGRDAIVASLRERAAATVTEEPLSYGQQALWLVHEDAPESAAYNVAFAVSVDSTVDVAALRDALQAIGDRHPLLRATYAVVEGRPVQRTAGWRAVAFEVHRRPDLDDEALRAFVQADYARPFDLERGPVWRTTLVTRGERDHVLLVCAHHIALDGWSLLLLLDELRRFLAGLASGDLPQLPRPEPTHAEYVAWQRAHLAGPDGEALARRWRETLAAPRVELEVPADLPRPARRSRLGATRPFEVPADLLDRLNALAAAEGTTLFVLLLAAYKVLLARYCGTEDVVVGTPTIGRDQGRFNRCIGHFVNAVPLRTRVPRDASFRQVLDSVRTTLVAAVDAQEYPLALMVEMLKPERVPGRSPLFETMFVLQRFSQFGDLSALLNAGADDAPVDFGGLRVKPFPLAQQEGQFDFGLGLVERDDRLVGAVRYATDLFLPETIDRIVDAYLRLLRDVADRPGESVARLRLLPDAQRAALVAPAPAPAPGGRPGATVHARFETHARATPDAVALRVDGASITYGELDRRADRLAHRLAAAGAARGGFVGLCLERGAGQVVAILAILKCGAAYVPIDPTYPDERIEGMLEDADVRILVTERALAGRAAGFAGVRLEMDAAGPEEGADAPLPPPAGPDDPIYVIFTSGSTGRPKGVVLTHRAVDRLLDATHPWFGFGADDVWTLFHSIAFDFSVWELWGALAYGGRLVVVPWLVSRSPDAFVALVRDEGVTVLNQTPSAFQAFIRADAQTGPPRPFALRHVIFGGEALELQSLRRWFDRHGDRSPRLVNMYGITETCVHVTYREVRAVDLDAGLRSPIGVPIPDLRLYVLEPGGEPAPVGVTGELHVAGPGLALGYMKRPELTAERFVPDPFHPGERMYRSGDLARRRADGEIEYLGRNDHQVKLRGFRIELGEIESAIVRGEGVERAVVVVREDAPGDRRLVAYVVPSQHRRFEVDALRNALRETLPAHMVPGDIVAIGTVPLTSNGKVDRQALPRPGAGGPSDMAALPLTDAQRRVAEIWRDVLGRDDLHLDANFFDLGGHSMLATRIVARAQEAFGGRPTLRDVFEAPTLRAFAARVARDGEGGGEGGGDREELVL